MDTAFLDTQLRRADPDRHLLTMFYPRPKHLPLQALYLLNHEIARTRSMVTDTNLGLIRLQWWRDEIRKVYGGGSGGEIPALAALAPSIRAGILPFERFETILFAREFDLEDVAPASLDGLRNYADFITTPLNEMALAILNEKAEEAEIQQISVNYALMEVIRSVPLMLSQARCYIPQDLLAQKGLTPEKIIHINHQADIADMVKAIAALIEPYRKAKSRLLRLQQRLTLIYMKHLEKAGFDVFSADFQLPPPFLALRLALARS